MTPLKTFAAFAAANAIGFVSAPICYIIALRAGAIAPDSETFNAAAFDKLFITGIMLVWLFCAVLSLGSFFVRGPRLRALLLLAPAVAPLAYGLSVLFGSLSSL